MSICLFNKFLTWLTQKNQRLHTFALEYTAFPSLGLVVIGHAHSNCIPQHVAKVSNQLSVPYFS